MTPKAQVQAATDLVARVLLLTQPADREVSAFFREHRALGHRDRAILAETVYRVLRQRLVLQHLAQSGPGVLHRKLVMLAWQGSDAFLRAALTDAEWQWLEQARKVGPTTLSTRIRSNLPPWLLDRVQAILSDEWPQFVQAMDQSAPLDLRVNLLKARREEVLAQLQAEGYACAPTPHSPWGIRLEGKPALQKLAVMESGQVEVQDEGSQLLALLTDAHRGEMVADFCAGAGGKTLALGASMRNTGRLYAFDTSGHRLAALRPRLARSGLSNVHPAQLAHERDERVKRLAGKMDRVLVDAPCSGLGTLRRNPDLKWRQSPETVEELQALQSAILASAARLVKPGGRLVYATCSILPEENESVIERFLADAGEFTLVDAQQELERLKVERAEALVQHGFLRLWPQRHATDGFFAAILQRRS